MKPLIHDETDKIRQGQLKTQNHNASEAADSFRQEFDDIVERLIDKLRKNRVAFGQVKAVFLNLSNPCYIWLKDNQELTRLIADEFSDRMKLSHDDFEVKLEVKDRQSRIVKSGLTVSITLNEPMVYRC